MSAISKRFSMAAICVATVLVASGCDLLDAIFGNPLLKPVPPCGDFTFQPDCNGLQTCYKLVCGAIPGPRATVTFQFQPNRCDQTCSCNKVAMAQALRLKRPDNSDIPLSDAQSARTVHNTSEPILDGWAIDRDKNAETGTEWLWGFYGMNDDGSFDSEKASRGDNATPAKLTDSPGTKLEKSYSVEVIDVPVCLDDRSPCFQRALGYFVWGWSVGGSTLQRAPECDAGQGWFALCGALAPTMCERMPHAKAEIGILYYKKAFCLALQAWNDNLGPRHPFTAELLADVCSGT